MSIAYKNKKKVVQDLHHPRLRKIRYEFRCLLKLWYSTIIDEYLEEIKKIQMDKSLSYKEMKEQIYNIHQNLYKHVKEYSKFPLGCDSCSNIEKNLVYLPNRVQWLCIDCYEFSHKNFPKDYP